MSALLSDTSAFVLVLDKGRSYKSTQSKKFLSYLDLSEGHKMCNKVPHLRQYLYSVVPNRKLIIHHHIRTILKKNKNLTQVLVLACGWDPILVKLSEEFPQHNFFGVDNESIHLQKKLVKKLMPRARIFYIQEDLTNVKSLLKRLSANGWQTNAPTCIVMEGIIYYIRPIQFWKTFKQLTNNIHSDCFIFGDFSLDGTKTKITKLSQKFINDVFGMIKRECAQNYYLYGRKQMRARLSDLGFSNIKFFTMDQIQKQRTGKIAPWKKKEGPILVFTAQKFSTVTRPS